MTRTYCKVGKCSRWANLDHNGVCPHHVALDAKDKGEVIYKCLDCDQPCTDQQKALLCERCDSWVHASCAGVENDVYDIFFKKGSKLPGIRFFCKKCDDKVTEVIEKCSTLEQDTITLKKEMIEVRADIAKINETIKTRVNDKVSDIMNDKREIDRRKMNLMVFGLPEAIKPAEISDSQWNTPEKVKKRYRNTKQNHY